ncbi:MAG TPA: hypothetical protein VFM14_06980 [Gemmatimonadales bacterium]|nr:hypothetical protein [Gemmatimonadales bacterium]
MRHHQLTRYESVLASPRMYDTTTFLNVDLDLTSHEDLAPLADALRRQVHALHVGRVGRWYQARFELNGHPRTPDSAIRRLAGAIQQLPPRERARWNRAARRDFNIGIQAAERPHCTEFPIQPPTVALVGKIGGRIVLTVYGSSLA